MIDPARAIVIASLFALAAISPVQAQSERADIETIVRNYLAQHPDDVERIVRNYLIKNPDVVKDALSELLKRRVTNGTATNQGAAIKSNAKLLFESPRQVSLGDPQGDVTVVEFFDYNCGYCKRALADMLDLMKDDRRLRFVLKEFPILGPGSTAAARVAVAVRMQDSNGEKYLAFHQRLLGEKGSADEVRALTVAREIDLDMARLEKDIASDEVRETLAENVALARSLGISGTPGYVVGDAVITGAVGARGLKEKVRAARK